MRRGISGQVTVFSAIIMAAVLMLAGILVDAARMDAGRGMVRRAVETAAGSLLADYSSRLKDGYGLFAISVRDKYELQDRFEEYLASNLGIPCNDGDPGGNVDLFGFRIERVDVTPIYNLSENGTIKAQILEYMKYRAPTELVEGFMYKLTAMKDLGAMSEAYRQKVGIDKLLAGMDKSQQKLKRYIDGLGDSTARFVNGFNSGGSWVAAFNEFNSLTDALTGLESRLGSLESSINSLKQQLADMKDDMDTESVNKTDSGDGSGADKDGSRGMQDLADIREAMRRQLSGLEEERRQLETAKRDTIGRLDDLWHIKRDTLTSEYIGPNRKALDEITSIARKGEKAQQAIARLEQFIGGNFPDGGGAFLKDFKDQLTAELAGLKELILEGRKAGMMIGQINDNISTLEEIVREMDAIRKNCGGGIPAEGLPMYFIDMIGGYRSIDYDYSRPEKGGREDDPRKGKSDEVKKLIHKLLPGDVDYEAAGFSRDSLPSYSKVITEDFSERDMDFIGRLPASTGTAAGSDAGVSYNGDLGNVGNEADLYDEENVFQENALDFISKIGNLVSGQITALRDSIYINEYIMGTFKNSVPELAAGNGKIADTDLHGVEKGKKETFYDSEVEYILHGQPSQELNNIMTRGELLLVRFGLNALHVYTDPVKRNRAMTIASAISGWWTGGGGIPLVSNLIMAGWSLGESVIDVRDLLEGRSVPIYKMKGDWRLDIGIASEAGPKTDPRLHFNYHDYLRLFLLAVCEDTKLGRIGDLIQLNMCNAEGTDSFRMSGCNTCVRIEAEVSMKYLFITHPFIRRESKTGDGRYLYKVLLYEGY